MPDPKLAARRALSAALVALFVGCAFTPPAPVKAVEPPPPASPQKAAVAAKKVEAPLKDPPNQPEYPCPAPQVLEDEDASKIAKDSSVPPNRNRDVEQGTVKDRLPPEVIQRIIRGGYGQFRSCYEQGLGRDPNLIGHVTVRFVIGPQGTITSIHPICTSMPDREVVRCITEGYRPLTFPQPKGGVVTVVYPIMFSPGD